MSKVRNSSILGIPQFTFFFQDKWLLLWLLWSILWLVDLAEWTWLAASAVRLQVPDYNQLFDYNCIEWSVKYKATDAPITFEKIVMVMINIMINIKKLIREPGGESVIRTKHRNGA